MYEVVVGNIGTVYSGKSRTQALLVFEAYKDDSERGCGRAGGESVVLMHDGDIVEEHEGILGVPD